MQILLLGAGYIGSAFAKAANRKFDAKISGTSRTVEGCAALSAAGFDAILFDSVPTPQLNKAASQASHILASIPPTDAGDPALGALGPDFVFRPDAWLAYLSTTGVYGDRGGGWAFEDEAPTPLSKEATRRVDAEKAWRGLALPAHVFRLPGIYGPGRSAIEQVLTGKARRIDKPGQVFSRAHRDDIVAALLASAAKPNPGSIYNICDDLPGPPGDVILEACKLLGAAPPPLIPFEEAGLSEAGKRFYNECKRVSTARAKQELSWKPQFPTYVEGLAHCYQAYLNAGSSPQDG